MRCSVPARFPRLGGSIFEEGSALCIRAELGPGFPDCRAHRWGMLPACHPSKARTGDLRSPAQGGAFLENRRGAGNLARSRLSGGSWAMSEPSSSAEGRLKAGCSQDWLPHKAARVFIIRCDAAGVMSNLCHLVDAVAPAICPVSCD